MKRITLESLVQARRAGRMPSGSWTVREVEFSTDHRVAIFQPVVVKYARPIEPLLVSFYGGDEKQNEEIFADLKRQVAQIVDRPRHPGIILEAFDVDVDDAGRFSVTEHFFA